MQAGNRNGLASRFGFVVCGALCVSLMIFVFVLTQRLDRELLVIKEQLQDRSEARSAVEQAIEENPSKLDQDSKRQEVHFQTQKLLFATELAVAFQRDQGATNFPEKVQALVFDESSSDILWIRGLSALKESPLSAQKPALLAALREGATKSGNRGFWVVQGNTEWVASPKMPEGRRLLLRISEPRDSGQHNLEKVSPVLRSALLELTEPVSSDTLNTMSFLLFGFRYTFLLLTSLLLALGSFLFRRAHTEPLGHTVESARAWMNGESEARADASVGSSQARRLATVVNSMIEHAEVRKHGRLRVIADGSEALATSLRGVGKGDLKLFAPTVPPELTPISTAFEQMNEDLNKGIFELYERAIRTAISIHALNYGSAKIRAAFEAQTLAITTLGEEAERAADAMKLVPAELITTLDTFDKLMAAHSNAAQRIRIGVGVVGRRAASLGESAQRFKIGLVEAAVLDEALDLLSVLGDPELSDDDFESHKLKAAGVARRARQALEGLKQLGSNLRQDLEDVRNSMSGLTLDGIPSESRSSAELAKTLTDATREFAQLAERTMQVLGAVETNAKAMSSGAGALVLGLENGRHVATQLDMALSQFDLDGRLDQGLLERLTSLREEYEALDPSGADYSKDGASMISEIQQTADDTKARINRMIDTVEATADSLRNPQA